MASSCLVLDGSQLEGGGQILRNSLTLSALLGRPVQITKIRAGRSKPGLKPQHLMGLQLLRDLCGADVSGDQINSTDISFYPDAIRRGAYTADTKTAGSTVLLLQVSLPVAFFADGPVEIQCRGGTDCEMAPPIDYFTQIFTPLAKKFGLDYETSVRRRGYFPRGGGEVVVRVNPSNKPLSSVEILDRGQITRIYGIVSSAGLPPRVSEEMIKTAQHALASSQLTQSFKVEFQIRSFARNEVLSPGASILLIAETSTGCSLAGSSLSRRGLENAIVGANAAEMLIKNIEHGGCVDDYLQDQIILLMALGDGRSVVRTGPLTLHTKTAIFVSESIAKVSFSVESEDDGRTFLISCHGRAHGLKISPQPHK